jgi:putative heme degradation protein
MKRVIPTDVYDKDGNMTKIEVTDTSGNHIADFLWDEREEQSSENRVKFREWCYDFLRRNKQFEVAR